MYMKPNCACVCSAILCSLLSIPALSQSSVNGASRDSQSKVELPKATLKLVDEKLKAAADMMRAEPPNYDQAIAIMTEATRIAPDQDGVWYRLGVAYMGSSNTQTDAAEKTRRSNEAYSDLKKAIELLNRRKSEAQMVNSQPPCNVEGVCKHVETVTTGVITDDHKLAVYYSNLGDAAARLGKNDEAINDFQQAAQIDVADAGTYFFDLGVILRNAARTMDERKQAAEAFDKAIAADPKKAAAYYLKGEVLFGLITTDAEGKPIPPPGAVEALRKYLELQPNGKYAGQAKSFLMALNGTSEDANQGTNPKP